MRIVEQDYVQEIPDGKKTHTHTDTHKYTNNAIAIDILNGHRGRFGEKY